MSAEKFAVDVRGITKIFNGVRVVDRVDMQISPGEIRGFLGPNGSGKTTFIRMLCGLLTPNEGEGTCLGYDVRSQQQLIKRHVGYMTQRFSFYEDLSIEENLDFIARMYEIKSRREAVEKSLERLGLTHRRTQLTGTLSGGWKQRVALAACMIHEPQLLLLDEPTAGVDPKARREFWEEIHGLSASGITVLISTHYMDEAERCHKLAYIAYGQLLSVGTGDQVIANAGLVTWRATGPDLQKLSQLISGSEGVEQVAAFGNSLHVSGTNPDLLEQSIKKFHSASYSWEKIQPGLEDVFIRLMQRVKDRAPV